MIQSIISMTIAKRKQHLQDILRTNPLGICNLNTTTCIKEMYKNYWNPLTGEDKYDIGDIEYIEIKEDTRYYKTNKKFTYKIRNSCIKNKEWDGIGNLKLKYLAGSKRKFDNDFNQLCRNLIQSQIIDYKITNPSPDNNNKLEVDHKDISLNGLINNFWNNELDESEQKKLLKEGLVGKCFDKILGNRWCSYHKKNATYQYLPKCDNIIKGGAKTYRI